METIGIVPGGTTRLPNQRRGCFRLGRRFVLSCIELIRLVQKVQSKVHRKLRIPICFAGNDRPLNPPNEPRSGARYPGTSVGHATSSEPVIKLNIP